MLLGGQARCPLDLVSQKSPDFDLGERCFCGMRGARVRNKEGVRKWRQRV